MLSSSRWYAIVISTTRGPIVIIIVNAWKVPQENIREGK